jgi:hypothetical protein
MHFCVQPRREARSAQGIRVLHLSLNAPVIAIDALPVGPARAGIALCEDAAGDLDIQIAVRSLRSGQVAAYVPTDGRVEIGELAVDAALSFAEGMGFLFDEDEVAARGEGAPDAVAAIWRDLVEEVPERLRTRVTETGSRETATEAAPEPALEVPVVTGRSRAEVVNVETLLAAAVGPAVANPAAVLSKFRIIQGSIGAPAAPAKAVAAAEASLVAPVDSRDSRIRLLSSF